MKEKAKILVVEDESITAEHIARTLVKLGYEVAGKAQTGPEAIKITEERLPDLILMDIMLKGDMTGIEAAVIIQQKQDIPIIYLTAYSDGETLKKAKITEPYGYMLKPFEEKELHSNIEIALYKHKSELALKKSEEKLRQSTARLHTITNGFIQAISFALESRDPYTAGHQRRVANLASRIASAMELSEDKVESIYTAAVIHDIGKISVPAEILSKPGKLTKVEYDLIKVHPQVGFDILKSIDFPWPLANFVYQHHERINGSGYPLGIQVNDILTESKIISVADVVEAMASHRPYRPTLGISMALDEITKNKGILYDGDAVEACLKVIDSNDFEFDNIDHLNMGSAYSQGA